MNKTKKVRLNQRLRAKGKNEKEIQKTVYPQSKKIIKDKE